MSRIRILSDRVANQIAAGEVVERPVSVIKELVENSLDAGATRVEVEFRGGGVPYMRVEDNGSGMSPDDAMLCLERHATSKLLDVKDLDSINSFGFRGEAIPSIASVSRFVLRTRSKDRAAGCEVMVNGGRLVHRKDYGMAVGTQIEVINLFNSVPARRKFLKTENTEAAHIVHMVRLYAVSNPGVSFVLMENGRVIFKSPASNGLRDRVSSVWGSKLTKDLVEFEASEGGMRMWGLLSKPGVGRATRQEIITLVNGRPVTSKTLSYALLEAYHTYVPKGRYPVIFCFLEVPPDIVDVNVHPAKREVRFRQEALVRQFLIQTVLGRLRGMSETVREPIPTEPAVPVIEESLFPKPRFTPMAMEIPSPLSRPPLATKAFVDEVKEVRPPTEAKANQVEAVLEMKRAVPGWRFVGHLKEFYGLFETEEGLIVLDFKRAQERIWYERALRGFAGSGVVSQPLLFPIPVELEPLAAASLEGELGALGEGGFKVVVFGRNFYRIEAVPEWLNPEKAERFLRDVASLIQQEGGSVKGRSLLYEKVSKMACDGCMHMEAPKGLAGVMGVVEQLLACENPLTCPRGNATYYETTYRELGKRFGR